MEAALVTVYILNHNYEDYLVEAIESVLNQTYKNLDIIIIDNGSSDNSKDILDKYRDTQENIRIIEQENVGLVAANNIAIKKAKGKYIIRLDADDYFHDNAINILVETLENFPKAVLAFPDFFEISITGSILKRIQRFNFNDQVSLHNMPAHGACTLIKLDVLKSIGGYDTSFDRQDGYYLWMKLIVGGYEVTNVNKPLFYYRQHPSSLSKDLSKLYTIRSKVIKKIANSSNLKKNNPLGIIPTRGSIHNSDNFDFEKLDGKYVIDWTVQSVIESETLNHIILSSPDKRIRDHIKKEYPQIEVRDRKEEQGFQNISLYETIKDILEDKNIAQYKFDTILVKTIDTPFLESHLIDQAINNIKIFNQLDSIVGVSESNEVYYQHDGSSLNEITNSDKHRLERETLFKKIKGFNIVKSSFYQKYKTLTGGVMGHIDVDEKSAFKLDSIISLSLADTLAKTIKNSNN